MNRILVLVEGPTERAIFDQVFAPDLGAKNVFIYARVVGEPGHKGGNKFDTVRREIKALAHQEPESTITMFFDYYGLDENWPGITESAGKSLDIVRRTISESIGDKIKQDLGEKFVSDHFIPYVQFHEVESLLFSDPEEMANVFEKPTLKKQFEQIVEECGGCEQINNNFETAPSKRIKKLFPSYKKGSSVNAHAFRIAHHIGVEKIRQQCPYFNDWYTKLEQVKERI